MEADLMMWAHRQATPALDAAFRFSWLLGVLPFCAPAVLLAIAWHLGRWQRREALAWAVVGLAVAVLPELVKTVVARPRPTLWPWLIPTSGYSFPSGHATAGAALYPLLGWLALRSRGRGAIGYGFGLAIGVFVGVGRLYVGVHWPSDVLAGWALGMALSLGAVRWLSARGEPGTPQSPNHLEVAHVPKGGHQEPEPTAGERIDALERRPRQAQEGRRPGQALLSG